MRNKLLLAATAATVLLAGCGGSQVSGIAPASNGGPSGGRVPMVVQNGKVPINWTQLSAPATGYGDGYAVVQGHDKNMWFGNNQGGLLQVKMVGTMTLFPMSYVCNGTSSCNYVNGYGITVGSDNHFYMAGTNYDYTHSLYVIGSATTAGALTVHDIPSGDYSGNGGLTLGPDGNVWFTEQKHLGKISTTGAITEYNYPSGASSNSYGSVTTGPDHNIWFTEYNNNIIGKIVPSTHAITEYSLSTSGLSCDPSWILPGPDGNLYFYCTGNEMGQITTSGVAKEFYAAYDISYLPTAAAIGPDGFPWFADANGDFIGEFNTTNLSFTNYAPPYTSGTIYTLALGPDNNFWAPDTAAKIDVYINDTLTVSPSTIKFTAAGQTQDLTVTEPAVSSWTSKSTNPGVASVAQGSPANNFVVTAHGAGSTNVTISDHIGNSFVVKVTVK